MSSSSQNRAGQTAAAKKNAADEKPLKSWPRLHDESTRPAAAKADATTSPPATPAAPVPVNQPRAWLLDHADQLTVAALVAVAMAAIVAYLVQQGALGGRLIDIEHAPQTIVTFQVNLNTADWPELCQLPDLGETLARRIVASRETHGPFRRIDDLSRVKGIGPRKMEQIRPFLLPIDDSLAAGPEPEPAPLKKPSRRAPSKPSDGANRQK